MQQLENDLDQAQEQLLAANAKLEEKDKALQNVSDPGPFFFLSKNTTTSSLAAQNTGREMTDRCSILSLS